MKIMPMVGPRLNSGGGNARPQPICIIAIDAGVVQRQVRNLDPGHQRADHCVKLFRV